MKVISRFLVPNTLICSIVDKKVGVYWQSETRHTKHLFFESVTLKSYISSEICNSVFNITELSFTLPTIRKQSLEAKKISYWDFGSITSYLIYPTRSRPIHFKVNATIVWRRTKCKDYLLVEWTIPSPYCSSACNRNRNVGLLKLKM